MSHSKKPVLGSSVNSASTKPPAKKKRKVAAKRNGPSTAVLDTLFSHYIRRFGECELWGMGGVKCSTQMQCSHIKSRSFLCTRWLPSNAVCACAAHHRWQHDHPDLNVLALIELFGQCRLDEVQQVWLKGEKPDRNHIADWLREELKAVA